MSQEKGNQDLSISIVVPLYNESIFVKHVIYSLLAQNYKNYEIILVNDGSTNNMMDILRETFKFEDRVVPGNSSLSQTTIKKVYESKVYNRLYLIDKVHSGKADSVNVGISLSNSSYIFMIDGDTVIKPDCLSAFERQLTHSVSDIWAIGGPLRISNRIKFDKGLASSSRSYKNWPLVLFQELEYLRSFVFGRIAWSMSGLNLIISGASFLAKRSVLLELGGLQTDTVGEDFDLTVAIHKHAHDHGKERGIIFSRELNCFTEVPFSYKHFISQRKRWYRGLIEVVKKHKQLLFNPKYKSLGLVAMPYIVLFELLAPIIYLLASFVLTYQYFEGQVNQHQLFLLFSFSLFLNMFQNLIALHSYEYFKQKDVGRVDKLRMIFISGFDFIFYLPFLKLTQLFGLFQYFQGVKGWGKTIRSES